MSHEPTLKDLQQFMNTPEGQELTRKLADQQKAAAQAAASLATSLGILVPGMDIDVNGEKMHVLDAAHEHAGAGWFYVSPVLPEEARNQVQVAPLRVLFHPPTAEYAVKALQDPTNALKQVMDLARMWEPKD